MTSLGRYNFREGLNLLERLSILRPSSTTPEITCPCGYQIPAGESSLCYVRPDGKWETVCRSGNCVDAFMHSDDHFTDEAILRRSGLTSMPQATYQPSTPSLTADDLFARMSAKTGRKE